VILYNQVLYASTSSLTVNNDTLLGDYPTGNFKEILTISESDGVDRWGCYNASLSLNCRTITFAVVFILYLYFIIFY
jgi:hypothetical protein